MTMHPRYFKKIFTLVIVVLCVLVAHTCVVSAQETGYKPLEPIPDFITQDAEGKITASNYIAGAFTMLIAISGVLAIIMIIFGGIKYMSTDAFNEKSEAKGIISNAVWGFLLAISAWLILNTISPNTFTTFDLNIERVKQPTTTSGLGGGASLAGIRPGYTLTPEQVNQDQIIRDRLSKNIPPVVVNNSPCTTGGTSGCTNVVGLPENAISGVLGLASSCDCLVRITGGTEGGHQTHDQNAANIDIGNDSSKLNNYIRSGQVMNPPAQSCSRLGTQYQVGGAIYVDEGTHWHVCY